MVRFAPALLTEPAAPRQPSNEDQQTNAPSPSRYLPAAESESHEGKRKTETLWPIMRIVHTRSR